MSEDLFAPIPDPIEETNLYEKLVGENAKFKTNEDLARAKVESDRFIERLKQENEGMRKDLTARLRLEELVTKLGTQVEVRQSASNEDNQGNRERDGVAQPVPTGLTPEQAEAFFNKTITERENFKQAQDGIKKIFGPDYQHKLDTEAKKLGISAEYVNALAKQNPDLFIRIFQGAAVQPDNSFAPPQSSMNTAFNANNRNTSQRTRAYYKNLKATDPTRYLTKEVQNQEYQDAMKLGEAFFDAD